MQTYSGVRRFGLIRNRLSTLGVCLSIVGCQGFEGHSSKEYEGTPTHSAIIGTGTSTRIAMREDDMGTVQAPNRGKNALPLRYSFSTDTLYSGDSLAVIIPLRKDWFRFHLASLFDGDAAHNFFVSVRTCSTFSVGPDSYLVQSEILLARGDVNDITYPHRHGINYTIRSDPPLPSGKYAFIIKWITQNPRPEEGILSAPGEVSEDTEPWHPYLTRKIWQGNGEIP